MRRVALIALLLTALLAPPAAASDQSVYDAWVSRDADFTRLGKRLDRQLGNADRSGYQRVRRPLRTLRGMIRAVDELQPVIRRENTSSDAGRRGKKRALASNRALRSSFRHARRWLQAARAGHTGRAGGHLRRANRLARKALRLTKAARKAFKQAGVTVKPAP
jgi:hypothetical protein